MIDVFRRIKNVFKAKKESENSTLVIENHHINSPQLRLWTAGIKYDNRIHNLLSCRIKEKINLVREPENESDPNAIHVKREDGSSLGFIGKKYAKTLAAELDAGKIRSIGYIINLKADLKNAYCGVKITIPVHEELFNVYKSHKKREIDYIFESSSAGNLYLLLDSEQSLLTEIVDLIETNNISTLRSGISFTPSSSGKIYQWYIRIENESDQPKIEKLLRDRFPVLEEKYDRETNAEYIELQEEELEDLKQKNKELEVENESLKNSVYAYEKDKLLKGDQFEKMLEIFLPQAEFIRDSKDVLKIEVKDYTIALTKIHQHYSDPKKKCKKVHSLNKWFEFHYSTGQSNDGRIYFNREGNSFRVLVSFKRSQKKDINYLRNL